MLSNKYYACLPQGDGVAAARGPVRVRAQPARVWRARRAAGARAQVHGGDPGRHPLHPAQQDPAQETPLPPHQGQPRIMRRIML